MAPDWDWARAVDSTDPTPLHAQLERSIRVAMASRRLRPGDQLPTVRQLAVALRINANTVAKVYSHLERDGGARNPPRRRHLRGRPAAGTQRAGAARRAARHRDSGARRRVGARVHRRRSEPRTAVDYQRSSAVMQINIVSVLLFGLLAAVASRREPARGNAGLGGCRRGRAASSSRLAPRVARQWERAVVLRLGRFIGLRGPGLFWVVPFIDTVTRQIDQRVITTTLCRRADADLRHGAGQRRRRALLDRLRRREGRARSAGLPPGRQLGGADRACATSSDAPRSPISFRDATRSSRSCSSSSTSDRRRGASPSSRSRCATS